jgi:streptomycin 3"-adenylyltransferase
MTDQLQADQLQAVVELVARTVEPIGVYLHGSAVHDGLNPASDLDVLAVTAGTLGPEARRALTDGLMLLSSAGPRPVELTVLVQSEVRPWRYPATCDFLYGEWLRAGYEAGQVPQPEPTPNLAIEISVLLKGNHPLLGPPPARLLDPVPHNDIRRASLDGIPGLLHDLDGDTRNVVLTFARIWATLATGAILSKSAAAGWALPRLPVEHRPVLAHARNLYLTTTYADETWPEGLKAQARNHINAVLTEINTLVS